MLLSLAAFFFVGTHPASAIDIQSIERSEVARINRFRAARGLPRLAIDVKLTRAAEWMGRDMPAYNYFGHQDHLGRDPFQRLSRFGYPSDTWRGENLAAGYPDVENTFLQWKNSPPHRANMANSHYRAIGIALVYRPDSEYQYYWVTEFGSRLVRKAPSAALLARYPAPRRVVIKRKAKRCLGTTEGGQSWRSMRCGRKVRLARRLALI